MIRIIILALLLTISVATAQFFNPIIYFSNGITYTGPGDVVSGAIAWYGLRAYSAAKVGTKAVRVRCGSGGSSGTAFDVNSLTSGNLDTATISSTCGNDGSVTASQSTTVLSITALLSGQVTIGDQVTGTGVSAGTYIVSAGTCVSGAVVAPCTFNVNNSATVASTTVTAASALFLPNIYDQSGQTYCSGPVACDMTQSTAGLQPILLLNAAGALNTLPAIRYDGTRFFNGASTQNTVPPLTFSFVMRRTGGSATFNTTMSMYQSGNNPTSDFTNSADTISIFEGTRLTATATDGTFHAIQGVLNGASSVINVDGTQTTGNAGAGGTNAINICLGIQCVGMFPLVGHILEGGAWVTTNPTFTTSQQNNMCNNQRLYWGTPGSC